jgi:peroxiredoxin
VTQTLQTRLDAFKVSFESKAPPDKLAVMHRATADLRALGQADRAVRKGDRLPPFALPNQNGKIVRSEDLLASGPLVVSFFRGAWCPYCMIEIGALSEAAPRFAAVGATVIAITPQTEEASAAMVRDKSIGFDVLTDAGLAYSEALGLAFELPHDLRDVYRSFGIDVGRANGDGEWRLPMPTRLVVGRTGFIADATVDPDYTVRPDPADTIAVLRQLSAAA